MNRRQHLLVRAAAQPFPRMLTDAEVDLWRDRVNAMAPREPRLKGRNPATPNPTTREPPAPARDCAVMAVPARWAPGGYVLVGPWTPREEMH